MTVLHLDGVDAYYGASHVLREVSLDVGAGEAVALLGRNGAGKTTTFNVISGLLAPRRGSVRIGDREIAGAAPHAVARAGVALAPSGRRAFGELTVEQNLRVAASAARGKGQDWSIKSVYDMFPALVPLRSRLARYLSGGEQQMLKIARALLIRPSVLLLDEPSEGLAPVIVHGLRDRLLELKASGMSMLISEQNSRFALAVADRAYVLVKGEIEAQAAGRDVLASERMRRALSI